MGHSLRVARHLSVMQANVFSQALLGQQSRATLNAPGAIWRNKSFFTNTWSVDDMPRQDGKNFVVTGGSTGIGFHAAKELAQHGGHVIIAARRLEECRKAADTIKREGATGKVEAAHLDLSSFRSICDFANKINDEEWPLDVLINNAGTFLQRHRTTEEGFELTGGVNYFGPFLLTHLLLNKLKDSKPSRIVTMSSLLEQLGDVKWNDLEGHTTNTSGLVEYSNSKIMILMMGRELNKRLKGKGVESYLSQPGLVKTPLNGPKLDYSQAASSLVAVSSSIYGQQAEVAAACLQRPATDPTLAGLGGSYFSPPWISLLAFKYDNAGRREPSNALARDEQAWSKLYTRTLEIVNSKLDVQGLPPIEPA